MGPNYDNGTELLENVIENGMNVARFNFSHGDYAEHEERINKVKEVSKKMGKTVSLMLDTKGPIVQTIFVFFNIFKIPT